jgi:hypothetical protein
MSFTSRVPHISISDLPVPLWPPYLLQELSSSFSSPFPVFRRGQRFSSASQSALARVITLGYKNFTSGCPWRSKFAISLAREISDWVSTFFKDPQPYFNHVENEPASKGREVKGF